MSMRVVVFGAGGQMGRTVCAAVADDPDLDLVGAVDPAVAGETIHGVVVAGDIDGLADVAADVSIDFTRAEPARANLAWAAAAGVHAVVGTTGFTDDDYDRLRRDFTRSNVLVAPNFAIGAVLMMRFAELAAPWFETAEVIELHHDGKVDAPSGTAALTVERMAAASAEWGDDPTRNEILPGARGATGPAGIHVHSVRLRGLVAHHELLFGTTGQILTIRHDSLDRSSFMPGVVLAAKGIADLPGLTIGLEPLLGL